MQKPWFKMFSATDNSLRHAFRLSAAAIASLKCIKRGKRVRSRPIGPTIRHPFPWYLFRPWPFVRNTTEILVAQKECCIGFKYNITSMINSNYILNILFSIQSEPWPNVYTDIQCDFQYSTNGETRTVTWILAHEVRLHGRMLFYFIYF